MRYIGIALSYQLAELLVWENVLRIFYIYFLKVRKKKFPKK